MLLAGKPWIPQTTSVQYSRATTGCESSPFLGKPNIMTVVISGDQCSTTTITRHRSDITGGPVRQVASYTMYALTFTICMNVR